MCSVSHSGDLEHANEAYPRNKNYSNKGNIDLKRGFSQTQVQGRFYSRYHTLWDFANNFSIFTRIFATKLTSRFWGFSV